MSICCITYNHENYLAQALDSFLAQETDFPVEILVHDDASTDRTPAIIREYVARHPGRVKGLFQAENQYSRGSNIFPFVFDEARGDYIACCEADDYFTDPHKLQRQVDFLNAHPEYSLSTHEALIVDDKGRLCGREAPFDVDCEIPTSTIIEGGGGMVATSSMVFRAGPAQALPDYYERCVVGDYPLAIHLALNGKVHYVATPMSAYRAAYNNWTYQMVRNTEVRIETHESILQLLSEVDALTAGRYSDAVDRGRVWHEFELTALTGQVHRLKDPRFAALYADVTPMRRAWERFRTWFPRLGAQIAALRRNLRLMLRKSPTIVKNRWSPGEAE